MTSEFNDLLKNNTWSLVPPSRARKVIGCKWVFRIKLKVDGSVDRYKARLIAKGFINNLKLTTVRLFSPVVKPTTIRLVLSLAIFAGWSLCQIDIRNAFLHGHLSKEVYMQYSPGFQHPSMPHHLCHLQKALYGLKQAPCA